MRRRRRPEVSSALVRSGRRCPCLVLSCAAIEAFLSWFGRAGCRNRLRISIPLGLLNRGLLLDQRVFPTNRPTGKPGSGPWLSGWDAAGLPECFLSWFWRHLSVKAPCRSWGCQGRSGLGLLPGASPSGPPGGCGRIPAQPAKSFPRKGGRYVALCCSLCWTPQHCSGFSIGNASAGAASLAGAIDCLQQIATSPKPLNWLPSAIAAMIGLCVANGCCSAAP